MIHYETTDSLDVVTSAAGTLDVIVAYSNLTGTTVTPDKQQTAITTATTTPILTAPGAGVHKIKCITVRNKHATTATDVTFVFNSTIDSEIYKTTILAGQTIEFIEGVGWYTIVSPGKLDARLFVTADYVNATTSFTDITGLTQPVTTGLHYCFMAHLFHRSDATTSGSQFGINGPAMTLMSLNGIQQITSSVTAAAVGASPAVTALDTAAVVETTGPGANTFLAILSGYLNPSASGTFAVRGKSEIAVASGLTVKKGSWCNIWEVPA